MLKFKNNSFSLMKPQAKQPKIKFCKQILHIYKYPNPKLYQTIELSSCKYRVFLYQKDKIEYNWPENYGQNQTA